MATNDHNISRRNALVGIGLAGVTAIVPVAGATVAKAADRSAWDAALVRFRRVNAEYDRLIAVETEAGEAVGRAVPREDRFFDEYDLRLGMSRGTAVRIAFFKICEREQATGIVLYPADKRKASEAKVQAMNAEADRIADEFMAYQQRHADAVKLYRVKEWEAQVSAYRPRYFEARDALMATPAPDENALLVKMEIASTWIDDPYADATFADARRLLGRA